MNNFSESELLALDMSSLCKDIFIPVETNAITGEKRNMFPSLVGNCVMYLLHNN